MAPCVPPPPLQVVGLEARVDVEMRERQRLLSQASELQAEVSPAACLPVARGLWSGACR